MRDILLDAIDSPDLGASLTRTLERVSRATGWTFGESWLVAGDRLVRGPVWHEDVEGLHRFRAASREVDFRRGQGLPGEAWAARHVRWSRLTDPGFVRRSEAVAAGLRTGVAVPVLDGNAVVAVLAFFTPEDVPEDPWIAELVGAVAAQIGAAFRRKLLDDRLRASEERYAATLFSIGDAVLVVDLDARITHMNPVAEELTGWTFAEARGRPIGDVFVIRSEDTGAPADSPVDRALREGQIVGLANHTELVRRDGTAVSIEDSAAPIRLGAKVHGVVLVFRDATSSRVAETMLRRSQEELRQLVEGLPDGVLLHRNDRIVYANAALGRRLAREPQELIGRSLAELVVPDDAAALRTALRDGECTDVRLATERPCIVEVVPAAPIAFDGTPASVVSLRDVTATRVAQARLASADRMAALGQVAASIAHEINNPLAYTLANLGHVLENLRAFEHHEVRCRHAASDSPCAPAPAWRQALGEALEGAERVATIVRDLRTFSRDDADTPASPTDLHQVLDWAMRTTGKRIGERARLVTALGDLPPVHGHGSRLAQVFVNLLLNAADAIPPGQRDDHEVTLTALEIGGAVEVRVADTGVGLAPEAGARLFQPFFTTKPPGEGTGLGLAVAHAIVTGYGGTIALAPAEGRGTVVIVRLPVAGASVDPAASAPTRPAAAPARARILLVDDDRLVRTALVRALGQDHEVVAVSSGEEGLRQLLSEPFDVVLSDLMMPGMSGMDFYEAVRGQLPGVERRFVFFTGGAFTTEARDFLGRVPNPCLEKPITAAALRDRLTEILRAAS